VSDVCMTPITTPKAWRGETLAREASWIVTLTEAEVADVDRALATAKASGVPLEEIQREHFPLTAMRSRLEQAVAEMYDGRGFVLLRGLPVRRYTDDDVGLIFWGFGRYMGAPLYQNPQGELLGHVYDHGRTTATSTCAATRPTPTCRTTPTRATWWGSSACAAPSRADSAAS